MIAAFRVVGTVATKFLLQEATLRANILDNRITGVEPGFLLCWVPGPIECIATALDYPVCVRATP